MASRKKSNDTTTWLALCIFAFVCFIALSGCEDTSKQRLDTKQRVADNITCHWSAEQIDKGACWCVENGYRRTGITLAPNKFCGK